MTTTARQYETHWRMNPATRSVFDRITAAAVDALGPAGPDGHTALDIGCGGQSNVVFPTATRVIGVDVDADGLARNTTVTETRLCSINELDLEESFVDAIACIFTLEHVTAPDVVFGKLARALRPGGVLVIAIPQVRSPKALVTRHTPQRFHDWFYRRVLGRDPESNGTPFDTVLDPAIAPDRLRRLAAVLGLHLLADETFEDNKQKQFREKIHLSGAPWRVVRKLSRTILRHDAADTDYMAAFQRPA